MKLLPPVYLRSLKSFVVISLCLAGLVFGQSKSGNPGVAGQTSALDTAWLDVNRWRVPLLNQGSIAFTSNLVRYPSNVAVSLLFDAGFALSATGKGDGSIHTATQFLSGLFSEIQPGQAGGNPEDPRFRWYPVTSRDPAASRAFVDWKQAVELGAPFVDLDHNGIYEPQVDLPDLLGDKTLWTVMNDGVPLSQRHPLSGPPINVEIQWSAWAYRHTVGPLADALFLRYVLSNPNPDSLKELYFSALVDADIGEPDDDFIASDTNLAFGYFYNAGEDIQYAQQGLPTPALGVLILQGPAVPSPGDTAWIRWGPRRGLKTLPGYRNLETTSILPYDLPCFSPLCPEPAPGYFIRSRQTGPFNYWDASITPANYGIGGDSLDNPFFIFPGDPLTQSGWRDDQPGDKRLVVSTGPFSIPPGEVQEIVVAYVAAMGNTALNSVHLLREHIREIRRFAQENFSVAARPPLPRVQATHSPNYIQLHLDLQNIARYDLLGKTTGRYQFEGIKIYQLAAAPDSVLLEDSSQARLVASLDAEDQFGNIYGLENGRLQLLAEGRNNLPWKQMLAQRAYQFSINLTEDAFRNNQPLLPYQTYWLAVLPYGIDLRRIEPLTATPDCTDWVLNESLLTPPEGPLVVRAVPGSEQVAPFRRVVARHSAGRSEGRVEVQTVIRSQIKPHQYQVRFFGDGNYWQLWDATEQKLLLDSMQQQLLQPEPYFPPTVDGFVLHVFGVPDHLKQLTVVEGDPVQLWFTGREPSSLSQFALLQGGVDILRLVEPDRFPFLRHRYFPVRIHFEQSNVAMAYWWQDADFDSLGYRGAVPTYLQAFDVSDPENPRQVNIVFSSPVDRPYFGQQGNYQIIVTDSDYDPADYYHPALRDFRPDGFLTLRLQLVPGHQEQESRVVLQIDPYFPNSDADRFEFSGQQLDPTLSVQEQRSELEKIKVVPNPYFLHSAYESPGQPYRIQFTHVPQGSVIRIFTLAGQLVKKLQPEPLSGIVGWDLTNSAGRRVAAGVYIAHISLPGVGSRVLKFAIVPRQ